MSHRPDGGPAACVEGFLRVRRVADWDVLRRLPGVGVRRTWGDLGRVRLDSSQLDVLAALPQVRAIEVGLAAVRGAGAEAVETPRGRTARDIEPIAAARGALLGIVDFSLNLHVAQLHDGGDPPRTRLCGLHHLPTGRSWSREQIDAELEAFFHDGRPPHQVVDLNADAPQNFDLHGTFVTILAARAAPDAPLYFVDLGPQRPAADPHTRVQVVDAVQHIVDQARALGVPCVINLSVQTLAGPRDGSRLYQQALERVLGPDDVLVVAAGDQHRHGLCGGVEVGGDAGEGGVLELERLAGAGEELVIDLWAGAGVVGEVEVVAVSGVGEGVSVQVEVTEEVDPLNGDWHAVVRIREAGGVAVNQRWAVRVVGAGAAAPGVAAPVSAWLLVGDAGEARFLPGSVRADHAVSDLACGLGVVSVGIGPDERAGWAGRTRDGRRVPEEVVPDEVFEFEMHVVPRQAGDATVDVDWPARPAVRGSSFGVLGVVGELVAERAGGR